MQRDRRGRRGAAVVGLTAALGVLGLAVAAPALAAEGRIVSLTPEDTAAGRTLTVVFQAAGLAPGVTVDPKSVAARLGTTSVPVQVSPVGTDLQVRRVAVLAIDVSGSMKGPRLDGAKKAANLFLDALPDDVLVGLVTFATSPQQVVAPTQDRAQLRQAVARLQDGGSTALYDGAIRAVAAAGSSGIRNVVLLSDGKDDGSSAKTLGDAVVTIKKASGVTFDVVAVGDATGLPALQALAEAGRGSLVSTLETEGLGDLFEQSARTISNQLRVVVTIPPELAQAPSIEVSALVGGQTIKDDALIPLRGAPQASPTPGVVGPRVVDRTFASSLTSAWLYGGLGAVMLGLSILLGVALAGMAGRELPAITRRMSIYTLTGRSPVKESEVTSTALGGTQVARSAVEFAGRMVQRRGMEAALSHELEKAAVPLKPGEWAIIHLGLAIGASLLALLLTGGRLVTTLIGLLLGVLVPFGYLSVKATRRRAAFHARLPDILQLMAGSLQSGYSMPQSVDTVVREGTQPIATEFNRALVETRLGVPLEDALDGVAERMDSLDFAWVVMAIRIQRQVGGNLAEVLTNVAATLRERERLRRQVQVLSAEGRLSGWILALLPMVFGLYLLLVRPDYLRPLWTTTVGLVMLGVAAVLMVVGTLWLRRVVTVEV